MESSCRNRLANGVPADAPICEFHQQIRDTPGGPDVLRETISSGTALFPVCGQCVKSDLGRKNFQTPQGIDNCCCATYIVNSDCSYCVIGRVQEQKTEQLLQREKHIGSGDGQFRTEFQCSCGNLVFQPEEARKCVGCGGIITRPFRNFAGDELDFEFASMQTVVIGLSDATMASLGISDSDTSNEVEQPGAITQASSDETSLPDYRGLFGTQAADYGLWTSDSSDGLVQIPEYHLRSPPMSASPPSLAKKSIFSKQQMSSIFDLDLVSPDAEAAGSRDLTPGQKVDKLLLANQKGTMHLSDIPKMLQVCGFPSKSATKIGGKVKDELWREGLEPKCLAVLHVLRKNRWAER